MTSTTRKRRKKKKRTLPRGLLYGGALLLFVAAGYLLIRAGLPGQPFSSADGEPVSDTNFPPLIVERLDGGQFDLQRDHGEATVLFAMAYWCGTCIPESQALATLQNEMGPQGLVVVPVDIDPTSTPDLLNQFIDYASASNLTFVFDSGGAFVQTFKVRVLDTTIILDAEGNEVYRDQFPTTYETLRAELEKVLGA